MVLDNYISVIPFWGRPKVSEIVIQNLNDIGLRFIPVCTYTDEENIELLKGRCEKLVVVQNNITGQKWNKGLSVAKDLNWDKFIILGSDDLVSYKYFAYLKHRKEKYIGMLDAVAMNLNTKKYRYWRGYTNHRHGESIGVGRIIDRSIIENLNYELFPNILKSRIDMITEQNIRKHYEGGYFFKTGLNPYRIGLKSGDEFSISMPNAPFIHSVNLSGYYSDEVIKMIRDY